MVLRYLTSVVPIGAMFAMTLWLGNSAYLYISVAFAQMLKAISKYQTQSAFSFSIVLHCYIYIYIYTFLSSAFEMVFYRTFQCP